jgi:hypothetical protein
MNPNSTEPTQQPDPAQPYTPETPPAQPTQPAQIEQSTQSTSGTGAAQPGPVKNNKKLIFILVGSLLALLVIGSIVFIAFVLSMPSRADYRDAIRQYNDVSRENTLLTSRVTALGLASAGTDESFNSNIEKTEQSIAAIKEENEKLGDMKAVKRGDAVPLYKTFDDKLDTYLAYGEDLVSSLKIARPAIKTCDAVNGAGDTAARITALKSCSSNLASLKEVPNKEFNDYLASLKTGYAAYASNYEAINNITDPYGAQFEEYKKLRDAVYATQAEVRKATTEFSAATRKHDDSVSVKASAKALSDLLEDKQR